MVLLCIIKDAMYKHRIIECNVNDSSDWDWIYDEAVQNTLKEYFKWADDNKGNINFEKSWADVSYTLTMQVDANFEDKDTFFSKLSSFFTSLTSSSTIVIIG